MNEVVERARVEHREEAWRLMRSHLVFLRDVKKLSPNDLAAMERQWEEWRNHGKDIGLNPKQLTEIKAEVRRQLVNAPVPETPAGTQA